MNDKNTQTNYTESTLKKMEQEKLERSQRLRANILKRKQRTKPLKNQQNPE